MFAAVALLVLSCELHGAESSPDQIVQSHYSMRYRFDPAHRSIAFSNGGRPWRSLIGGEWTIERWDDTGAAIRAAKGMSIFDFKALTLDTHVVEHRGGQTIAQRGHARCTKL